MLVRIVLLVVLGVGCDEGQVRPVATPAIPPVVVTSDAAIGDAMPAKPELFGKAPATLGSAFDGLALGQAIDQAAAKRWLKQRGIDAIPFVRDGHLASLWMEIDDRKIPWPQPKTGDSPSWFDPATHQHASETITEQGELFQFDLEVPIERWMSTTGDAVVPFDLVTKSLDEAEHRHGPVPWSNQVDSVSHVTWTDSALVGAATATEISVYDIQAFRNTHGNHIEEIPGAVTHSLKVSLDAPLAVYEQIDQRLVELFGKSVAAAKAQTWKRGKLRLTHKAIDSTLEHIELEWER